MRGALAEAEKLHHKDGVVASSLVASEICIEVCAESVLGLMGEFISTTYQIWEEEWSHLRFGRSLAPRARIEYIEFPDVEAEEL